MNATNEASAAETFVDQIDEILKYAKENLTPKGTPLIGSKLSSLLNDGVFNPVMPLPENRQARYKLIAIASHILKCDLKLLVWCRLSFYMHTTKISIYLEQCNDNLIEHQDD